MLCDFTPAAGEAMNRNRITSSKIEIESGPKLTPCYVDFGIGHSVYSLSTRRGGSYRPIAKDG